MRYVWKKGQYKELVLQVSFLEREIQVNWKGMLGEGRVRQKGVVGLNDSNSHVFGSKKMARSFLSFVQQHCEGSSHGFYKKMYLQGIGYRVRAKGRKLLFQIGYNHLVEYTLPSRMIAYAKKYRFVLFGLSKEEVNREGERLIRLKVPDSYKGKGVREENQFLRLKKSKDAKKN